MLSQTRSLPEGPPGQSAASSPLPAALRPSSFRLELSQTRRKLHTGSVGLRFRVGLLCLLYYLQIFTSYLQFLGEQDSATGQGQVTGTYFGTNDSDMVPTTGWKAIPSALVDYTNPIPNPHWQSSWHFQMRQ